jgi:hypothetical protein
MHLMRAIVTAEHAEVAFRKFNPFLAARQQQSRTQWQVLA